MNEKNSLLYPARNLEKLETIIDYKFKSTGLLYRALRHPSADSHENKLYSYEKLEFLGDKVLNLIVAEALFQLFPNENEGELSVKLNYLISGKVIAQVAGRIGLGEFIEMSSAERNMQGTVRKSNLENCMEALIGAIYLDNDSIIPKEIVLKLWEEEMDNAAIVEKDPKTQLQEWLQSRGHKLPEYQLTSKTGSSHSPIFNIKLICSQIPDFEGSGSSLKFAQLAAATEAMKFIKKIVKPGKSNLATSIK